MKYSRRANMASTATDLLIGKVAGILESEACSIVGVRDQVDEIKQVLISMKSFLKDAEGKKPQTEGEETWVASVTDLAYDVEDIIDEFMYHMHEQQSGVRFASLLRRIICFPNHWNRGRFARWLHRTRHNPKGRFASCLHKAIHIPNKLWYRRQIGKKLQKITKTIKRYDIDPLEGTSSDDIKKWVKNQAESSLFIKEDELVGIEDKKQILMGWLMNGEQQQAVISVVGMGGSGKTTLVAKTFTSESVKRHFSCYAWITVSQSYVIEDLFRSLIKEVHQATKEEVPAAADLNSMSYRELLHILVTYLESRRYLVVWDDVWDIKLLKEMRIALPNRQLGSRIMLTTRKEDIAFYSFGVESHVHRIQPLEKNEAWELFSKKAFSTYHNKRCPPELESSAWELLGKCKGLPLAIVALGGLMSSKESSTEWRKVCNSINWHLINDHFLEPLKTILFLSFNDLPYRLKHCFLYCSIFPEDYLIRAERLIRLWIAEGFVEHVKGVTLEEVSECYLMELNFRSMLQVVRCPTIRQACKMHDLMRELALSTLEKENFCVVYDGREVMEEIRARRLSIQTSEGEIKLRSFHVFVTGAFSPSISSTLLSQFKLLRILDLEDVPIEELPDGLMYLFSLRYLSLSRTSIKKLPESIGQLCNLQTLDINSEGNFLKLFGNMTQLTHIGITNVKGSNEMNLCTSIQNLKLLRYLYLLVTREEEFLRRRRGSSEALVKPSQFYKILK
ncbi:NB-ARC domain-containing disease resistance protein [Prunus dulcis]|uniref:NB-ARC domain-containing disease resistance protein n=1 Tax=Prunus dulcis TaxID=3755 RepID=A0A4Y1RWK4_PRUDU|nr:NB-ARC domain-containing disease resistance protein [Prunus dulcis]